MKQSRSEHAKRAQTPEPPLSWRVCVGLVAAVTLYALDRITKAFVANTLMVTGEHIGVLPGIVSFRFVANTGAAFSLGEGMGIAFALLAAVVVLAIAVYLIRTPQVSRIEVLGLGLVAGGAVGNALDRVLLGYVIDFIATDFIDFPVFNVADIGICVGVVLAFIGFMFLSPAAKVDATAELNARDERGAARRAKRREDRVRAGVPGGPTASPVDDGLDVISRPDRGAKGRGDA